MFAVIYMNHALIPEGEVNIFPTSEQAHNWCQKHAGARKRRITEASTDTGVLQLLTDGDHSYLILPAVMKR